MGVQFSLAGPGHTLYLRHILLSRHSDLTGLGQSTTRKQRACTRVIYDGAAKALCGSSRSHLRGAMNLLHHLCV